MSFAEHQVASDGWAVTIGAGKAMTKWIILTVDEEEDAPESPIAGVALTAQQAREIAALLVDAADRAEGKT